MRNEVDHESRKKAEKTLRANLSPRFSRLDRFERYVSGEQYEGRPSFWDDSVPLFERAPCKVYPITRLAIASHVSMLFGEQRWPGITSGLEEDDSAFDERFGLDEEESEAIDRFVAQVCRQTRFRSVMGEMLRAALGCGTAAAIACVKSGRLKVDTVRAKWCTPTFDEDECVTSLDVRYTYLQDFYDEVKQKWVTRCLWYRRTIDVTQDVTFKPVEADEYGREPGWAVDKTFKHGFGFCPVVWYRRERECSTVAELDGSPIHKDLLDEIDALNFDLSQEHRAALYAGDPQPIEIGVGEDVQPAPMGRQARTIWMPGDSPEMREWYTSGTNAGMRGSGRRRGPGVVWRYPDADSKVHFLTLPGDALKALTDDGKATLAMLKEAMFVVFLDPEHTKLGADISGRALEWMHSKQTKFDDELRADVGDHLLLPLVCMLLRIALKTPKGLYIAGLDKAAPILKRYEAEVEGQGVRWFAPDLRLKWPPYFLPTEADQKITQDNAIALHEAGGITQQTLVEKVAPFYGIRDVPSYMDALEEEAEQKASSLHAAMAALQPPQDEEQGAPEQEEPAPVSGKQPIAKKAKAPPQVPPPKPGKAREPAAPKTKKPPVTRKKVAASAQAA